MNIESRKLADLRPAEYNPEKALLLRTPNIRR
jgi:hypothetical protein